MGIEGGGRITKSSEGGVRGRQGGGREAKTRKTSFQSEEDNGPRPTESDRLAAGGRAVPVGKIEVGSASFSPSLHSPAALDGNGGDGFVHEAQIGLDGAINCRDGRGEFGCTLAEWHRV